MAKSLTALASKPQLVKITLDSEEIVSKYEEPLEFYLYDRLPVGVFIEIANKLTTDYTAAVTQMADMILDEQGNSVCKDGMVLPSEIMSEAIAKVIEQLGK